MKKPDYKQLNKLLQKQKNKSISKEERETLRTLLIKAIKHKWSKDRWGALVAAMTYKRIFRKVPEL